MQSRTSRLFDIYSNLDTFISSAQPLSDLLKMDERDEKVIQILMSRWQLNNVVSLSQIFRKIQSSL